MATLKSFVVALVVILVGAEAVANADPWNPPPRRRRAGAVYVPAPPPRYVPAPRPVVYVPAPPPRVYVAPAPPPRVFVAPAPAPVQVVTPAPAPVPRRFHAYFGVGGSGSLLTGSVGNGSLTNSGGGFEIAAGAEIAPWVAFELNWSANFHNSDDGKRDAMHTLMLETHAFLTHTRVRPYVLLGVGAFFLNPDLNDRNSKILTGPGVSLGAGVDVRLIQALSVGAKVAWRGMYLDDAEVYGAPPRTTAFLHDVSGTVRVQVNF